MPALAADAAVELLLCAAFVVCFGMLVAYRYSLSPVLLTVAHLFQKVSIPLPFHHVHPLRFVAKVLVDIDASIQHWLALGVSASEGGIVAVFHAAANMLAWVGRSLGDLAWEVYAHAVHLEHVVLPRLLRDANRLAHRLTSYALHELAVVEHRLLRLIESRIAATWRHIASVEHALRREVDAALTHALRYADTQMHHALHYADQIETRLLHGIDSLKVDLTRVMHRGIDDVRHWVDARLDPILRRLHDLEAAIPKVESGLGSLSKEVQGLEGLFAAGAFATAVAVALDALGLGWTKCRNVGKMGKALCGLEHELVDFLLGAAVDVLVVENLCEIVHLEAELFRGIEPELAAFVGTVDALVGCHGATAPAPLRLTVTALPTPRRPLQLV